MNAIILAAGMGTRLQPITNDIPKSLVYVNDKPIIETQIEYLFAIGIQDITVVVGYLADRFDYLQDKYNVHIVFNEYYNAYNNIYTMSLVVNQLSDTYVIDADVFMARNFLLAEPKSSLYFSGKKESINEWSLMFNEHDIITDIQYSNGDEYIMSGVSYWCKKDAVLLADKLKTKILDNQADWKSLYWDDIVKENIDALSIQIEKILTDDWYEIDSITDYQQALEFFPNIHNTSTFAST